MMLLCLTTSRAGSRGSVAGYAVGWGWQGIAGHAPHVQQVAHVQKISSNWLCNLVLLALTATHDGLQLEQGADALKA